MSPSDVRTAIDAVLESVDFTRPGDVAYCQAVYDALKPKVGGAELDVYFLPGSLNVEARLGGGEPVRVVLEL